MEKGLGKGGMGRAEAVSWPGRGTRRLRLYYVIAFFLKFLIWARPSGFTVVRYRHTALQPAEELETLAHCDRDLSGTTRYLRAECKGCFTKDEARQNAKWLERGTIKQRS